MLWDVIEEHQSCKSYAARHMKKDTTSIEKIEKNTHTHPQNPYPTAQSSYLGEIILESSIYTCPVVRATKIFLFATPWRVVV